MSIQYPAPGFEPTTFLITSLFDGTNSINCQHKLIKGIGCSRNIAPISEVYESSPVIDKML